MKPVIALVGRPNVGKSTLFNRLTRTRAALVADTPGLTRDRNYGTADFDGLPYIVIDTGGLSGYDHHFDQAIVDQLDVVLDEANILFFLVDARDGLTPIDQEIIKKLRVFGKKLYLVINKSEGLDLEIVKSDFYKLGVTNSFAVSSSHGEGVFDLLAASLKGFEVKRDDTQAEADLGIKIAVVGRPNVGKSTLVNRLFGEDRVITYDEPGTTRDSIFVPFVRNNIQYTLIDTAGIRRRVKVHGHIEKLSVIKALQAIDESNVVILVIDASESVADQDLRLLGHVLDHGKSIIIAVNKWDSIGDAEKDRFTSEIDRKLRFISFAKFHFISALHGSGIQPLFRTIDSVYESANRKFATSLLTKLLESAVSSHPPPLVRGRRIKLRYAHQGGHNPPLIIIHGNQTDQVPGAYTRYLENYFREALSLVGTPVQFAYKSGDNPYKDKRNKLTPRQQAKKKRLKRFVKKNTRR